MLDEDLPDDFKKAPKPKEQTFITRTKTVLEDIGVDQFQSLPLDWITLKHQSGMPIYFHKPSRVCTLSKPYFLGSSNCRNHDIPITAIPCLAYRRGLEEVEKEKEIDRKVEEQVKNLSQNVAKESMESVAKSDVNTVSDVTKEGAETTKEEAMPLLADKEDQKDKVCDDTSNVDVPMSRQPVILPSGDVIPAPRVQNINNNWNKQHLTPEQLNDYCKKLFKFKTVQSLQFKTWLARRRFVKAKKALQYPKMPEGAKLISIPVGNSGQDKDGKGAKRNWVMNMNSNSCLSVFHEYVNRALHKQPVYEYKHIENASTPYEASVTIGGIKYGVGHGSSKRQAKSAAARASLNVLIPEVGEQLEDPPARSSKQTDFEFYDDVGIKDPRVAEFCATTGEPSPHAILRTCLLRNFGASDRHIHTESKTVAGQDIEMTMKVGKHSATVICRNKKAAKQQAAQAILQELHPHVGSWGSLLRLYGSNSGQSSKEKKHEEQEITLLQDKARRNQPNYAVLDRLRAEMRKLRERDESVVPIGTLLVKEDLPTNSGSDLNNVTL
ncbi:microprocessor complex subunit DGCR8 isoform X2 [Bicyclus anynana]|nr:microprocessor complex subunit DGCR8 isoform X2 [Bicyclus anynana]